MDDLTSRFDHMACDGAVLVFDRPEFDDRGDLVGVRISGPVEGEIIAVSPGGFAGEWDRIESSEFTRVSQEGPDGNDLVCEVGGSVLDVAGRLAAHVGIEVEGPVELRFAGEQATVRWSDGFEVELSPA